MMTRRARMQVLAICCMSILLVSLDNTIVNVALPTIQRDLGASLSQLQWIVDAYTVVLATLLILSGSIADRIGRKRVFVLGLALFSAGSLLCSAAPSPGWLIAFRALQGVGGSMLNPVAMSIIRNVFTDPRERAQAIGVWGGVVGISMALGPVVGGALTDAAGWRSIFWINVPIGILAIVLVARVVPESRAARPRRLDPLGQVLAMVFLATLTYAIIEAGAVGWSSGQVQVAAIAAAAAVIGFVARERRAPEPLIDLRFFRSVPFTGATLTAIAAFIALGGFLLVTNLYLQLDRGLSPVHGGLYTLPMAALAFVAAPISGRIVGRHGARVPLLIGGLGLAGGSLLLTQLTPTTATADLLLAYSVFGLGFGMVNPPITNTAVSGMPLAQAGVAAGVASTSRQVGSALGVAVLGSLVTAHLGTSMTAGFAAAARPAWIVVIGCGLVVLALGLVSTTARARESARRTAERFAALAPVPAGAPVR
jgi:EmrB/QacA subfamily drug resistance transporter